MPTESPFTEVCTVIYGRMVQKKLSSSQTTPLKNTTSERFPLFHPEKYFSTILKVRYQTIVIKQKTVNLRFLITPYQLYTFYLHRSMEFLWKFSKLDNLQQNS